MPAPVILFVYNRPLLARQTLQSLKANRLSDESELFIFSDGPKPDADGEQRRRIEEVRQVIRMDQWCKTVSIIEQENNKGLAASVIDGVTDIVNRFGKVIVVEDDVLLSTFFLDFMNKSLDLYEHEEKILAVGSWNYFYDPLKQEKDYFFFRYPDSKGWATFSRAWKLFEHDAVKAREKLLATGKMDRFNDDGATSYFGDMLNLQVQGKVNSWAIRWTATAVIHNMLTVFPKQTLSKNTGFGSESTHEKGEDDYNKHLVLCNRELDPEKETHIAENIQAMEERVRFLKNSIINTAPPPERDLLDRLKTPFYRLKMGLKHKAATAIWNLKNRNMSEEDQLIHQAVKKPRYERTDFAYRNYKIKTGDFLSVAYQVKECFAEEKLKFRSAAESPVIIDCGANVGISVLYFKSLYPTARIIAFEPDPEVFRYLLGNLERNHVMDVDIVNKAVWSDNNGVQFGIEGADGGSVFREGNRTTVPSARLKEVLEKEQEIDFLKIDIEGAEVEVITDCAGALKKVKNIFVEYHSYLGQEQRLDQLLGALSAAGFRYYIYNVGGRELTPFLKTDSSNGIDLLLDISAVRE